MLGSSWFTVHRRQPSGPVLQSLLPHRNAAAAGSWGRAHPPAWALGPPRPGLSADGSWQGWAAIGWGEAGLADDICSPPFSSDRADILWGWSRRPQSCALASPHQASASSALSPPSPDLALSLPLESCPGPTRWPRLGVSNTDLCLVCYCSVIQIETGSPGSGCRVGL